MPKFHKVAGSTFVDTLWRNVQCGELEGAWRQNLCGEYDTHKNSCSCAAGFLARARPPTAWPCSAARWTVFRRSQWYPDALPHGPALDGAHRQLDATTFASLLSKLSADRNLLLEPPCRSTRRCCAAAVPMAATSTSSAAARSSGAVGGAEVDEEQQHDDDKKVPSRESRSDPTARKRAIAHPRGRDAGAGHHGV